VDEVDEAALQNWVDEARRLLADVDRLEVGDIEIGEVLWWAPPGSDGFRPHEAVRSVMEGVQSDALLRGFATEAINSRGVTSRSMESGGEQERVLAARCGETAAALGDRWPRVASAFRSLERSYLDDATRWDDEAAVRADDARR
jgi:hypothetical protein